MRRVLLLVALCVVPVGAMAQTWSLPQESFVIGNTLVAGMPSVLLASGKGRGGGTPSPSPSPSPAPEAAPTPSSGRGESSFTYPPIRLQVQGPTVTPPPTQLPAQPPLTVEIPPIVTVTPLPPQEGGSGCCAPHATLSIPVQIQYRPGGPEVVGRRLPVDPGYGIPVVPALPQLPALCPACPVVPPEVVPPMVVPPVAEPKAAVAPPARYRVCNTYGQCILWP